MNYLFSEPHQTDKCTQGAGDDEAALKTICEQVLSEGTQTKIHKNTRMQYSEMVHYVKAVGK